MQSLSHRSKGTAFYGKLSSKINRYLLYKWSVILALAQIALFIYLYYPSTNVGQLELVSNYATTGQVGKDFAYLRPSWRTVDDFLCHCADFDPSKQNATSAILGPLVSLFTGQEYDVFQMTDVLNEYEEYKSNKRNPKHSSDLLPSTCVPWVNVESPIRPPRIAMMTMATYSKKVMENTNNLEDLRKAEEEQQLREEASKASLGDKEEYCRQHGYDFYAISDAPYDRPGAWSKIPAALTLLSKYDWLVSVDLDTVIVDHSVRLEEFIDPQHDAIFGLDENGINTGIFFVRSNPWSQLFLAEAWTFTGEPMSYIWWEQAAIMRLAKLEGIRNHIKLSPQAHFNDYPKNGVVADSRFIIHFAGILGREKWKCVLQILQLRKNTILG